MSVRFAACALPCAALCMLLTPRIAWTAGPAPAAALRPLAVDDLFTLREVDDPQLSPDGRWIAYTVTTMDREDDDSKTQIWMAPSGGGGEAIPMTNPGRTSSTPRWSPDGRYLAFLAAGGDTQEDQVWTLFREGGEAVRQTDMVQGVSGYAWAPDSRRLVLVLSDPTPAEAARAAAGKGGAAEAAKAPPPHVITRRQFKRDYVGYLDNRRDHLYVFDIATKAMRQLTRGDYDDSDPAWSPDGRFIAFTSNRTEDPDSNEDTDIWRVTVDAPDDPLVPIGSSKGPDSAPAWSPDGRWLAYASAADASAGAYATPDLAVATFAGDPPRLLTRDLDRAVSQPRWSRDGRSIYCLVEDEREQYLARVSVRDGRVERVIHGERATSAYALGRDGAIVALVSDPHRPSEIYAWRGGRLDQRSHVNDAVLRELMLGKVLAVDYPSADGTRIQGFVITPPGYFQGERYPALLDIHGGPVSQYDWSFSFEHQLYAANGYVVLMPNPRGSSGRGQAFSYAIWQGWGERDYEDVMAAVDHAVAAGYADPDRLGVGGWSYGGLLTNNVITKTSRFKAAISGAGSALYVSNYGHDEYQYWWESELGQPWKDRRLWDSLSPFYRADKVVTPTMFVGGALDWNVPILNGEQFYLALKRVGVPTQLVVYPNEHHLIGRPSYLKDLYQRYLEWYARYLRTAAAP
jgi:dipeptidyl aminopeptidase/acylaminoacyl peptidase